MNDNIQLLLSPLNVSLWEHNADVHSLFSRFPRTGSFNVYKLGLYLFFFFTLC